VPLVSPLDLRRVGAIEDLCWLRVFPRLMPAVRSSSRVLALNRLFFLVLTALWGNSFPMHKLGYLLKKHPLGLYFSLRSSLRSSGKRSFDKNTGCSFDMID
jgi:hypothetical protein